MKLARSISFALSVAAVVGCSGDALAPRADRTAERPNLKVRTLRSTATTADISVEPSGGFFWLGRHAVRFPKHSICALNSSYGPTEWDKPCSPAQGSVNFHVEVVSLNGREWLEFTPAVRFVPTTRTNGYVTLFMRVDNLSNEIGKADMQILWSPAIGVPGIDESAADSTQRTFINLGAGLLHRRIKHFSAYSVTEG